MITSCFFLPPGASPVQRCLVAGDDETGITVCRANRLGGCYACSMKLLQQLHGFVLFYLSFGLPKPIENKHEK